MPTSLAVHGSLYLACVSLQPAWSQGYDPVHHWWLSTVLAALPLAALLLAMLWLKLKTHVSALIALGVAFVVAVAIFHMPPGLGARATVYGAAYGLFPVFWIILPVIFLYQLTVKAGRFQLLQDLLTGVTEDSRLQLLLIAFALGGFFEGASGFGTPVAVCGTILIGMGFEPIEAAGFALLANTAPVAFGSLGTPVIALQGVTGLDVLVLTRIIAALLAPFCVLVPFWLIWLYAGFRRMIEVWPAILVAGGTFAVTQLFVARLYGPSLVDITASVATIVALIVFLRFWRPKNLLDTHRRTIPHNARAVATTHSQGLAVKAALPWLILASCVTLWGSPAFAHLLDSISSARVSVPGLHHVVFRMPPAVPAPTAENAVFTFNWLSATGTGILVAALVVAVFMRVTFRDTLKAFTNAVVSTRFTMISIATLMGLGFLARFCGMDATLGLAFARTGALYPFFGTLIGWLGTAFTGSDTSSNVLFGSLQKVTAQQLGISPDLMASANSSAGVMGKMIAPQSVVIASTATGCYGKEGSIIRFLLLHSFALACLAGLFVWATTRSQILANWILK